MAVMITPRTRLAAAAGPLASLVVGVQKRCLSSINSKRKKANRFPVEDVCSMLEREARWTPRLEEALAPVGPILKPLSLFRVLKLLQQQQRADARLAWSLFQWASQQPNFIHNQYTYCALIQILGRAAEFPLIWQLLLSMRDNGTTITAVPFTILINSYGRVGMLQEAQETFCSMDDFHCKPDAYTYNALLHILLKAQDVKKAFATISSMIECGCVPDYALYTTLITGLSVNGGLDEVAKFLDEMVVNQEKALQVWTYNALICSFFKAGQPERAFRTLQQMLYKGCTPNVVTYNTVVHWLCKEGQIDDAMEYTSRMKGPMCSPTTRTYNTLIDALFKAGRADTALSTVQSMKGKGCSLTTVTYTSWMKWLCDEGKINESLDLLNEMTRYNCDPDIKTYTVLIKGLFKAGRAHMVISVFTRMMEKGCAPDTVVLTTLLQGFCKESKFDEALWVAKQMQARGFHPDTTILITMLNSLSKAARAERDAIASHFSMGEYAHSNDLEPANTTIWRLCKEGNMDEVVYAWNACKKKRIDLDLETYKSMIFSLSVANRAEKAFLIFTEMLERRCQQG